MSTNPDPSVGLDPMKGRKPLAVVHDDRVIEILDETRALSTEEQNAGYYIMEIEPGVEVGDVASRPVDQQPEPPLKPGETYADRERNRKAHAHETRPR